MGILNIFKFSLILFTVFFQNNISFSDSVFLNESSTKVSKIVNYYSSPHLIVTNHSDTCYDFEFQQDNVLICVSNNSHRYHRKMCVGMQNCKHEKKWISLSDAIQLGRTKCGHCWK